MILSVVLYIYDPELILMILGYWTSRSLNQYKGLLNRRLQKIDNFLVKLVSGLSLIMLVSKFGSPRLVI